MGNTQLPQSSRTAAKLLAVLLTSLKCVKSNEGDTARQQKQMNCTHKLYV